MDSIVQVLSTKLDIPVYAIGLLIVGIQFLGWLMGLVLTYIFRSNVNKFTTDRSREGLEWAIGEISYLDNDELSLAGENAAGFIDTRSGRVNVRFDRGTLSDSSRILLGQKVRFRAEWGEKQPQAIQIKPLPNPKVKT